MKNENLNSFIMLLLVLTIGIFLFQNYLSERITGFPVGTVGVTIIYGHVSYFNPDVAVTNATPTVIDTRLNATISISSNTTSAGFFNTTYSTQNPTEKNVTGKSAFNKFITANTNITFTNITLYVNYTDSEITNLNLVENTLRLYHFNNVTNEWDLLPGGVDTDANYVYGTTTSLSTFGVFGSQPAAVAAALAPAFLFGGGHKPELGETQPAAPPKEEKALFDLAVNIVPPYEYVLPGEFMVVVIQIVNFGTPGIKDVSLTYSIVNGKEETVVMQEKLPVETSGEVARRIAIPYDMPYGKYKIKVVAEYGAFITTSYAQFSVVPRAGAPTLRFFMYGGQNALLVSIIVLATSLVALAVYTYSHFKKHKKDMDATAAMVNYMRAYFYRTEKGKSKP